MQAAVTRYRVMANVVGVLLVVLVFVAMPLKYIGDWPTLSSIVSPIHGLSYMIYLAFAFDLYRKAGWPLSRMATMVAGGLVPFLAFWTERKILRELRHEQPAGAV